MNKDEHKRSAKAARLHQRERMRAWVRVYDSPEYADQVLAEFDKRFPPPPSESQSPIAPAQNSEAVTTGWRSIETAPNDVSILVAYDDESIELVEAEDNNFKWSGRNPVAQSILGIVNPTHWMPLPETPQANEKEKGDG